MLPPLLALLKIKHNSSFKGVSPFFENYFSKGTYHTATHQEDGLVFKQAGQLAWANSRARSKPTGRSWLSSCLSSLMRSFKNMTEKHHVTWNKNM